MCWIRLQAKGAISGNFLKWVIYIFFFILKATQYSRQFFCIRRPFCGLLETFMNLWRFFYRAFWYNCKVILKICLKFWKYFFYITERFVTIFSPPEEKVKLIAIPIVFFSNFFFVILCSSDIFARNLNVNNRFAKLYDVLSGPTWKTNKIKYGSLRPKVITYHENLSKSFWNLLK